ncbi:hypothetical protein ACH5RR_011708 [Cinchona calisaya]|uniref:K Homology domain-containing protein n=1 Tax=Cinchona calisaya TaxID=153742 RepID=A0ABD3A5R8_9GENT
MDGNRKNFSRKRPNTQFKRTGGGKKGKWHNSILEESTENSHSSDTVYRILCQSRKIGSVIGKGGGIIKALREETQAKITVADSVPGSDERVILVSSPSTKLAGRQNADKADGDLDPEPEDNVMKPHCAAQDALLKVHDRIIEEDLGGADNDNKNEIVVTARLLVPNNVVGCLLGRKGDVIQRLRGETGANIRVLPADHLPSCAMSTDELVQISGKPQVAKKALYEVSTLMHQNPRKDQPPLSFPLPYGTQGIHHTGPPMANMPPPRNLTWSQHNPDDHGLPIPWLERYGNQPSGSLRGGFDGFPPGRGEEVASEFSIKILCSAAKIGGVIGKGGFNVKQLQQETGASIQVENVYPESDERVIRVSSFEVLLNPRSQTIDAILHLQNKTSECNEKGIITTRLLVPSSKVGCILGQGGHVINEMRRRTLADIRVFSKEDKPKCASDDEELVQISGNFGIAKDALAEIASRLRTRCFRDANAKGEPAPTRAVSGFVSSGNLRGGGPPPSGGIGAGSLGRYELYQGRACESERPSYTVPPSDMGYRNINDVVKIPDDTVRPFTGSGGRSVGEIAATRSKLQDPLFGGPESLPEFLGSSEHLNAAQSMFHPFGSLAGPSNNFQMDPNQSYGSQHGVYHSINPSQDPYENVNPRQVPYQNMSMQHAPYQNISAQGSFQY